MTILFFNYKNMKNKNIVRISLFILILILIKMYYLDLSNIFSKNYNIVKSEVEENIILDSENIWNKKLWHLWLKTDTSKINIDFDDILWGGPWKDGIPAINNPKFVSINNAIENMAYLNDKSEWISVEINWEAKFYPYEILVWHEIVNDVIWNKKISVTFCPLCWSAIVYDRIVDWKEVNFWVSWLLYDSNLLMYDNLTESLWSQSMWKSVVWDYIWTELEFINSNLMTFKQFQDKYSDWKVLSDSTWFVRNYWVIPYWDYGESDVLYFPVWNEDLRFHKKELFYITNYNDESIAFSLKDLRKAWIWEIRVWDNLIKATFDKWTIEVYIWNEQLKWYYEMWFSWVNHNVWNKNVWSK